jgi:hypothetical protein
MSTKKTYECFVCKNNGFPNVMVVLAGKDEHGRPIRKDPIDESDHVHMTKLGGQQQQVTQAQQPTPIPTYKQANDQRIAEMHDENREDRQKYRDLMREDVEAKLEIARAINKLAEAIKERGLSS